MREKTWNLPAHCLKRKINVSINQETRMNKKGVGLGVILLGTSLFYFFGAGDFLHLDWLKDNQSRLDIFYQANNLTVMTGFVALFLLIGLFLLKTQSSQLLQGS